jgi:hypothetical protein
MDDFSEGTALRINAVFPELPRTGMLFLGL